MLPMSIPSLCRRDSNPGFAPRRCVVVDVCTQNLCYPCGIAGGTNISAEKKNKGTPYGVPLFFWPARRDTAASAAPRVLRPRGIAASDFAPENSPPDCFLYGAHPLRVRIPPKRKREHRPKGQYSLFLARPEGFEPPAFGIGIHCDIQLRHGRIDCSHAVRATAIVHHFRRVCKRNFAIRPQSSSARHSRRAMAVTSSGCAPSVAAAASTTACASAPISPSAG